MTSDVSEDPVHCYVQTWIRILHILCNFILSLVGIGGIIVSVLAKIGFNNELKLLDHYQNVNVNVFLSCSVILVTISWYGIYAGARNCYKSMFMNGFLLGGFIVASTAYVATAGVITDYTKKGNLYKYMKNEMKDYNRHTKMTDILQTTLLCCGLEDVTTWNIDKIPKSCCRNEINCTIYSPKLQTNGCFKEFVRTGRYYAWILFAIVVACGLYEILGIILSHLQYRIIKDRIKKELAKRNLLKIPRPCVISELQNEENENEKDKEKNKEKNQQETKEETKDEIKKNVTLKFIEESKEMITSEKKDDVEKMENDTRRNICEELTYGKVKNILMLHFH